MKSYDFALKIINMYHELPKEKQEFLLSKQLLKSGTAIGARLESISEKDSRKDLFLQLSLSNQEVKETHYLLRLMNDSGYLPKEEFSSLQNECEVISLAMKTMLRKVKKFSM